MYISETIPKTFMKSIIAIYIFPNMSVEVTTKYDQLILSNFFELSFPSFANLRRGAYADTIATIRLPISSFIIVNLSFTRFRSQIFSIHIPAPPRRKLFPTHLIFAIFPSH